MQGKNVFSSLEANIIRDLLREKSTVSRSKQKRIRFELRKIGFYITDFDQSQSGFSLMDFENLVRYKQITISDKNSSSSFSFIKSKSEIENKKTDSNQLRERYKPDKINVLYIAESPPAGGTFFYAKNSNLYRCIRDAFIKVFGSSQINNDNFLDFFETNNCYLDDLCLEPVNDKSDSERIILRHQGIEPLSNRIKSCNPKAIIILMKAIESDVREAIKKSKVDTKNIFPTPFPSGSNENRVNCVAENESILRKLIELKILNI
jgi:hypothetical protein